MKTSYPWQVWWNDRLLEPAAVQISPFDRGYTLGEGVYEVVVWQDGWVGMNLHLKRLGLNLERIGIHGYAPAALARLEQTFDTLLDANQLRRAGQLAAIYLQITSGADTGRAHLPMASELQPNLLLMPLAVKTYQAAEYRQGVRVLLDADLRWMRNHIKSTALLGHVLHKRTLAAHQATEVLLFRGGVTEGELTEGASTNVCLVRAGKVYTPRNKQGNLLPGVTGYISRLLLQEAGIDVIETDLHLDDLYRAEEVWLTSSTMGIMPVTRLCHATGAAQGTTEHTVGSGQIGPLAERARQLYEAGKTRLFDPAGFQP